MPTIDEMDPSVRSKEERGRGNAELAALAKGAYVASTRARMASTVGEERKLFSDLPLGQARRKRPYSLRIEFI